MPTNRENYQIYRHWDIFQNLKVFRLRHGWDRQSKMVMGFGLG